jgi:hypothetical protein
MLCNCSNIDLGKLATTLGCKHHCSCANLPQSVQDGYEPCKLIWNSQWTEIRGDLLLGHDQGLLETQIIAKAVNQEPGRYKRIFFGQETRQKHQARLTTA